jgi:hypothetical protein
VTLNQPVGANGSATFSALNPQRYFVLLRSVPGNCAVSGPNPTNVVVTAGTAATITFVVNCR